KPAIPRVHAQRINSGQTVLCREVQDLVSVSGHYRVWVDGESACPPFGRGLECTLEIVGALDFKGLNLKPQGLLMRASPLTTKVRQDVPDTRKPPHERLWEPSP